MNLCSKKCKNLLIMPWQCSFKKLCFFAPIMPKILLAQSAKANPQVSRHNLLSYGTTYFLTAQFTLSRHNLLSSRHNLLSHGTTYFLTAKVTFLLQKLPFYCSRHNLPSHSTTYFLTAVVNFRGGSAGNQGKRTQSPLAGFPAKIVFVSIMASDRDGDNEDVV